MDDTALRLNRGITVLFGDLGLAALSEFPLPNGRRADLVALQGGVGLTLANQPDLPLDNWIFCGDGRVTDLWSAGRHVVSSGRHVRREGIARRYHACLAALAAKL